MEQNVQNLLSSDLGATLTNILGPGIFKALAALAVFLLTWVIAKFVSGGVTKAAKNLTFDKNMAASGKARPSLFIGKLVHYLLLIMGSMVALEILGVNQVLDPLKQMLNKFTSAIPNVLGAGVIGMIGYYIANFVSELVGMGGDFAERWTSKLKINSLNISEILKKIVFIVIFVPILIAALDYLHMDVITTPAKQMFTTLLNGIPKIILAVIIMGVFYFVGKYIVDLLVGVLDSLGLDEYAAKYNVNAMLGDSKVSKVLGNVAMFMILLVGATSAVSALELSALTNILNEILALSSRIIFGMVLLLAGNFIANMIYKFASGSNNNTTVANIAKYATLALFIAIALRQMGIANSIVELAFGLTLGSIAVAVALMYGLGGKDAAGEHVKEIIKKLKG